ncbi:MAG TPA: TlpA disulfide reductase family protein [Tepidisphaeraceae bacterium]|jgi:peroxiredoxin|nr:TlpA disulfide reductase family protein [Tepidisphaeraceae bacterium]
MTGKLSLLLAASLITSFTIAQDDDDDAPLPAAIKAPATRPTTRPAGPQAKVTPEVQAVLERINAAYGKLTTLELSGTISLNVEDGGAKRNHEAKFTSSFLAPNRFRHQVKDHPLLGSTGSKWYGYSPLNNLYTQSDAPGAKAFVRELPEEQVRILSFEDPSLILALSKDPSTDLKEVASEIVKVADENIDGKAHTTLSLTLNAGNKGPMVLSFDPQTNLLRRATLNMEDTFEKAGRPDITNALFRVDYTTIKADGALKPEQFAWAPPSGSKDMATAKAEALAAADEDAGPAAALAGKPAGDFTLDDMQGKAVTLSELKGSVVVLDFWATWCGPCVASLPHLNKIYKEFEKDGLKVYALNQREAKEKVADFITNKTLTIPVLLDKDGNVAKQYLVTGIPQTVVIGKDGVVKKVIVGFNPDGDEELRGLIAQEMKAK